MKALSLLQPWATLWMLGIKEFETRSWMTKHRGPLAIHASAASDPEGRLLYESAPIQALVRARVLPQYFALLPKGCLIGQLNIVGFYPIDELFIKQTALIEILLGNYKSGRCAWMAEHRICYPEPIKCKGSLGVWEIPGRNYAEIVKHLWG